MSTALDLTGQRFGRLTAERIVGQQRKQNVWLCRCDCGGTARVPTGKLRYPRGIRSCGCANREATSGVNHHSARLNPELVTLARRLWSEGYSLGEIVDHLPVKVDKSTLSLAVQRKTWKGLPMPVRPKSNLTRLATLEGTEAYCCYLDRLSKALAAEGRPPGSHLRLVEIALAELGSRHGLVAPPRAPKLGGRRPGAGRPRKTTGAE